MLSRDDNRWLSLNGGYRIPFDPRPLLAKLRANEDVDAAWETLWEELHHQGDVGEASYAAVPELVSIYTERTVIDWNTYAIVAVIDLARERPGNPALPDWLRDEYFNAIQHLAAIACIQIRDAKSPEVIRAMLSVLAISKGLRIHGTILIKYSDEELAELESQL
jgi:hypothetical protein